MSEAPVPAKSWPDVLAPFSDLIKTLLGPAAEQYGLSWGESAYVFRRKRLVRPLEKARKELAEAGIEPRAVKVPLLHDILDRGSLEDNDNLQDMWANLLVNAAGGKTLVTTAFTDILKSLSTEEAAFLMLLFRREYDDASTSHLGAVPFGNLSRLGLVQTAPSVPRTATGADNHGLRVTVGFYPEQRCYLTELGIAFIQACTASKATKEA